MLQPRPKRLGLDLDFNAPGRSVSGEDSSLPRLNDLEAASTLR